MTEQDMKWTSDDIAAAQEVLARSTESEVTHIITLTDEEIIILDGLQHEQVVPLPWLTDHDDVDRQLVGEVALRSLLARGMVFPEQQEAAGGEPGGRVAIDAVPQVTGPLVLRRTAHAVVAAERVTTLGAHWVYLYFHEDDTVLEEEIAASGHHSFSVYPSTVLGGRLAAFMDPAGTAVMDGRTQSLSTADLESRAAQIPALAEAVVVTSLSAIRAGSETLTNVTVYAGPHGVHLLEGGPRAEGTEATLTLREIGRRTLQGLPTSIATA